MTTQGGNVYMATYYKRRGAYGRLSIINVCPDALRGEPETFTEPYVSAKERHIWILHYLIGAEQMPNLEEHFDTIFRQRYPYATLVKLHHHSYRNDA